MATVVAEKETKKESPDRLSKKAFVYIVLLMIVVAAIVIYETHHVSHSSTASVTTKNILLPKPKPLTNPTKPKPLTQQTPYQSSKNPAVTG